MICESQKIINSEFIKTLNTKFIGFADQPLVYKDFKVHKALGKGSFGQVYKVTHLRDNKSFALKVLSKSQITVLKLWNQLENEIKILGICDHENIIKLHAVFTDEHNLYLVLELANGKTLFNHLRKKRKLKEDETAQIMSKIVDAIIYLHKMDPPILHRDLKPENVLFHDSVIKLADFGWSNLTDDFRNTYCGTPDYLCPEMIMGTGHNEKLDVWTLGVLMFELLHGRPPFTPKFRIDDKRLLQRKIEENVIQGKMEFDKNISQEAIQTIKKLLNPDPQQRPDAKDVINLPFFSNYLNKKNKNLPKKKELNSAKKLIKSNSKKPKKKDDKIVQQIYEENKILRGQLQSYQNQLEKQKSKYQKILNEFKCQVNQKD